MRAVNYIIAVAVLGLASVRNASAQGYTFNAGGYYTYEFTNFVFQSGDSIGPVAEVGLTISGATPGSSFVFTAYENNLLQTPLVSSNFVNGSGLPIFELGAAWQDFQGVMQIHMIDGSMTLLDFYGTVVTTDGFYYSEKPPMVPEPDSMAMFVAGGLVGVLAHRVRRTSPPAINRT